MALWPIVTRRGAAVEPRAALRMPTGRPRARSHKHSTLLMDKWILLHVHVGDPRSHTGARSDPHRVRLRQA